MANKTSQHILGTASNLLGFCLIIITSLHIAQKTQNSLIDELTSIISVLLILACVLSFASIKTEETKKELNFERAANTLFYSALSGIFCVIVYVTIKLWNE